MKQYDQDKNYLTQDMLDNNNYHKLDRAIAKFQELLTEKDLLRKSQEQQNHRLSSEIENIRETISNQEQIIDNISEQLKRKEHNLMDRQKSIRALIVFRNSSILYWLWLILTPGKKIIKKWIQNSSFLNLDYLNSIWHKLLITPQYSPREIDIPKSYYQKKSIRNR